jgi:hypothetical protein
VIDSIDADLFIYELRKKRHTSIIFYRNIILLSKQFEVYKFTCLIRIIANVISDYVAIIITKMMPRKKVDSGQDVT